MPDLPPTLLAALAGFITALIFSSIPVGPVNLTIINGAQRGFKWAMLIGLGAATMEVIYSAIAFAGFSSFFDRHLVEAVMKVFTFVFLLFLGTRFLAAKKVAATTQFGSKAEQLGRTHRGKIAPALCFAVGFVRHVMGNVGVLATWLVIAAYLMSHQAFFSDQYWVADNIAAKAACVIGVALGTNAWFCGLSFGMSRRHGQFGEKTLLRMQHFSGLCLIALGIFDGARMAWQLAHHKL